MLKQRENIRPSEALTENLEEVKDESLDELFASDTEVTAAMEAATESTDSDDVMKNMEPAKEELAQEPENVTEESAEEPSITQTETETEEVVSTPETPEAPSEPVTTQNDALLKLVTNMSRELETLKTAQNLQNTQAPPAEVPERTKLEPMEFIKDDEQLQSVLGSKDKLNELLSLVHNNAAAQTREMLLSELPGLVRPQIQEQQKGAMLKAAFFKDNPDLNNPEYMEIIKLKAMEIGRTHVNNPASTVETELAELATTVRGIVNPNGLSTPPPPKNVTDASKSFASNKTSTRPTPVQLTKVEKDLQDLIGLG